MARVIRSYEQVIGHRNVINWIKHSVEKDNIPNVMIFYGNPGLGKTSLAKLLAVDAVAMRESAAVREKLIREVIDEHKSTDSIKLFNMSQIQEKEEEIQKVKAELTVGFSTTGRKVIILDEGQNMSFKAQDSLLTDLEHLQQGVYVFICTTEIGSLRDALVSRSKATIQLMDLTEVECARLIKTEIAERKLRFEMSESMAIAFIASWADNQPRMVLNLLENFEDGSLVTSKELDVFLNTGSASQVVELLKYIYGSMPLGISYIESLRVDRNFVNMLIEVTKVAMGGDSASLSRENTLFVRKFMSDKDVKNLLQFTVEVASLSYATTRRVIAAFLRANVNYEVVSQPTRESREVIQQKDFQVMAENVEAGEVFYTSSAESRVPSLEELFKGADFME